MPQEIERKFLLSSQSWRSDASEPRHLVQGYFYTASAGYTLRVRHDGTSGFVTIKGRPNGISRSEFEYPVPLADAVAMLKEFCATRIVENGAIL